MVHGFNHNIMYRGELFHVQTEESGVEIPNIITLLYRGGVILGSIKTSYADILRIDNLEQVVEELMKEQHKQMMRRLKSGEFDERICSDQRRAPADEAPTGAACEATGGDESLTDVEGADGALPAGIPAPLPSGAGQAESDATELERQVQLFFGLREA